MKTEDESLPKLLGRLHHDLQNPLSILTGNVELINAMRGDVELDPSIAQSLDDIHAATSQLVSLLDRLLEIRDRASDP